MQITITVKDGATNKDIAAQLRFQAGLIEGMDPKTAASRKNTDASAKTAAPEPEVEADEDEDFAPAKTSKKSGGKKAAAAASFEDDEETSEPELSNEETETEESDDDFMEEKQPAKKSKASAKKLTMNDVNDACKAKAKATDRTTVLKILKKKFDVGSVTELKPEQYAAVIEAMKA